MTYELHFNHETPEKVKKVLTQAYHLKNRIRVYYGDTETGRDWLEEFDTMGRVGHSTGVQKVPLLIHNKRSLGGGAILCDSIVRIQDIKSGRDLYRADNYHQPALDIVHLPRRGYPCLDYVVTADSAEHARFCTKAKAEIFVKFIQGFRFSK